MVGERPLQARRHILIRASVAPYRAEPGMPPRGLNHASRMPLDRRPRMRCARWPIRHLHYEKGET